MARRATKRGQERTMLEGDRDVLICGASFAGLAVARELSGAAKGDGRTGDVGPTDRGDLRAPRIVDGLGWRRVLAAGDNVQPPEARLSRGLEVHPHGNSGEMELWIDRAYVPAGYGWSFPADEEVRVGVGSFDPRFHVKEPTVRLTADVRRNAGPFQGNWIPHEVRPGAGDALFLCGDRPAQL